MTDHADTIRRVKDRADRILSSQSHSNVAKALARDSLALLAECQQAIDERDAALENQADVPALVAENGRLKIRCEQAIDALRTLAYPKGWPEDNRNLSPMQSCVSPVVEFCRDALLSLGEQP